MPLSRLSIPLLLISLVVARPARATDPEHKDAPAGSTPAYSTLATDPQPASAFHESVAGRYNYFFGKSTPFLPSNATTASGRFLDPQTVPTAEYCGHCHKESYRQWRQSVHSNAFRAPWYLNNVNMLIDEKGVQYSRHCEGCHNPVALLSGDLSQGMPKDRPFESEGITCMTCHSIQEANRTGTGSYVMVTPAVMVDEAGAPITRPVPDAEILAHLDRHSKAVMQPFYRTPEFCETCHKAAIPRMLNDYKWLRAFTVYDEWQGSSFAKQSPLPFYRKPAVSTCQTCHMMREPVTAASPDPGAKPDPEAKVDKLASHRWLGGNSLMPDYYKYPEQSERLAAYLKQGPDGKGVLNVDIFSLEREQASGSTELLAPLGLNRYTLAAGDTLIAGVVVQNKGIGHTLIPEQRDFYEAWVRFTVRDSSGKVLAESGFLEPDGSLDPAAHSFTNRLIDTANSRIAEHQIWHTRVQAYNNTIQSGRSQLARYRFRLPKQISGPVAMTAAVLYRRFNQPFLDFILKDKHVPEPVLEIASETRTLAIGENAPQTPGPQENPMWMRWNNYGIALLDAQQYPAAVEAFRHVAELRPDYADAFTNQAVVQVAWQKYDDARASLKKALELLPGDPRALYYQALVERNANHLPEALTDMQAVVEAYPSFKDGLRELGFILYQQHDYPASLAAYQRLQAIDPDDLAAHYQLAILYRRLGDKDKAALESSKFADQKDDPSASVYALEFLSKHPEVAAESVVWHAHDLTGDPVKPQPKIDYHYIPGAGI